MADKQKRWVIYYDETLLTKMNRLREETAKKDYVPVEEVTVAQVVRAIVEEKYVEYVDKKNNRSRITTLAESQTRVEKEVIDLRLQLGQLTLQLAQLTSAVLMLKGEKQ